MSPLAGSFSHLNQFFFFRLFSQYDVCPEQEGGISFLPGDFGYFPGFRFGIGPSSYSGDQATEAFRHTGYTGTCLVCDPVTETYLIVLTNRAHPEDGGTAKDVRAKLAKIVFDSSQ